MSIIKRKGSSQISKYDDTIDEEISTRYSDCLNSNFMQSASLLSKSKSLNAAIFDSSGKKLPLDNRLAISGDVYGDNVTMPTVSIDTKGATNTSTLMKGDYNYENEEKNKREHIDNNPKCEANIKPKRSTGSCSKQNASKSSIQCKLSRRFKIIKKIKQCPRQYGVKPLIISTQSKSTQTDKEQIQRYLYQLQQCNSYECDGKRQIERVDVTKTCPHVIANCKFSQNNVGRQSIQQNQYNSEMNENNTTNLHIAQCKYVNEVCKQPNTNATINSTTQTSHYFKVNGTTLCWQVFLISIICAFTCILIGILFANPTLSSMWIRQEKLIETLIPIRYLKRREKTKLEIAASYIGKFVRLITFSEDQPLE